MYDNVRETKTKIDFNYNELIHNIIVALTLIHAYLDINHTLLKKKMI